jgi:hypothetical protein
MLATFVVLEGCKTGTRGEGAEVTDRDNESPVQRPCAYRQRSKYAER